MKPNPLSELNHLTVPCATFSPSWCLPDAGRRTGLRGGPSGLRPLCGEKQNARCQELPRAFKGELEYDEESTTATLPCYPFPEIAATERGARDLPLTPATRGGACPGRRACPPAPRASGSRP